VYRSQIAARRSGERRLNGRTHPVLQLGTKKLGLRVKGKPIRVQQMHRMRFAGLTLGWVATLVSRPPLRWIGPGLKIDKRRFKYG